jgi:UTP:GlnB (protein PII) uridylyltransferase
VVPAPGAEELLRRNAQTLRPGPTAATEVEIEIDEDGACWMCVTSVDRPGLLAAITGALSALDVWICHSEVTTIAGLAVDRFGLSEWDGAPLPPARRTAVQDSVLDALEAVHRALC